MRLVVNPRARRGRLHGPSVRDELVRSGVEIVDGGGPVDAIVVAGGDGTLAGALADAIALRVPVGIVPLGTFNELARTLEIPFDVAGACALVAAGRTRTIDVARVNGAYFVNEASLGVSSRIARRQRSGDKQRYGIGAIAMSLLGIFAAWRRFHAELAFDGTTERVRAVQITVANSHRFGGVVTVEGAAIDDGCLDLYCVEGASAAELLSVGAAILARRAPAAGLRAYRSRAFGVVTRRPHRITADGEPAGKTPARFEIVPNALRVFAP